MFLADFTSYTPPFQVPQTDALRWLAEAHARAASGGNQDLTSERFEKLLLRFGCGPDKIALRSTFLRDFTHTNWSEMQLFQNRECSAPLSTRMRFFAEALQPAVGSLYAQVEPDFSAWIHVSCTGYVSPSVIQKEISARGWGQKVEALHAYHMGCYASLPALRMAKGLGSVDVLHTELCTLHLNPWRHEPEQLVVQTLFADGVIRYRVRDQRPASGYSIQSLREWIAPNSLDQMSWSVDEDGFLMTLGREVPSSVESHVLNLVKDWLPKKAHFAIHPGGPRIVDSVKAALSLSEDQVWHSREILRHHGNMSSATLPHVWQSLLKDSPAGTPVISMAFGPGLTLSASLMEVV